MAAVLAWMNTGYACLNDKTYFLHHGCNDCLNEYRLVLYCLYLWLQIYLAKRLQCFCLNDYTMDVVLFVSEQVVHSVVVSNRMTTRRKENLYLYKQADRGETHGFKKSKVEPKQWKNYDQGKHSFVSCVKFKVGKMFGHPCIVAVVS